MARENDSARAYLIFAQGDLTFFFAALLPPQPPGTNVQDDLVNIKVNKLSSVKTQLPYEYYHLPFCKPDKIVNSAENLGEVLRGDRIENSM